MALEIDGIVPKTLTVNGTQVDKLFVDGTEVWTEPIDYNVKIETDLTGQIYLIVSGAGLEIDKGDGTYTYYAEGNVFFTPTGTVKVRFEVGVNRIIFGSGTLNTYYAERDRFNSIKLYDCSQLTTFESICEGLRYLTHFEVVEFNSTSTISNFTRAWLYCHRLDSFPVINTSSATNLNTTWEGCNVLADFPLIDTSKVTDFGSAWADCSSLTSFPAIDTSSGLNFGGTWGDCNNLVCLSSVNTLNQTATISMFSNCTALTAPNASEQTDILNGYNYVNGSPCP